MYYKDFCESMLTLLKSNCALCSFYHESVTISDVKETGASRGIRKTNEHDRQLWVNLKKRFTAAAAVRGEWRAVARLSVQKAMYLCTESTMFSYSEPIIRCRALEGCLPAVTPASGTAAPSWYDSRVTSFTAT